MPFPFLFEEPEENVARKAQNGRSARNGAGAKHAASEIDEEMNAAGRKAVRPGHPTAQDQAMRAARMSEQRG
jgi:hypothetical protein